MYTLGIDIGGTFTDFALIDDATGRLTLDKTLTTKENPAVGALSGSRQILAQNEVAFESVRTVIHGTTLVSNTIIERTGAKSGMLTTAGMTDVLELRRGWRYDVYDWQFEYPDPLVPRNRALGIDERIDADGRALRRPDPAEVCARAETLVEDHGVESIAVSLLHAYESAEHEQAVRDVLEESYPDVHVSLSSEVAPIIREYERTSTTVLNAYVAPVFDEYLGFFEEELRAEGFEGDVYLMTSSGGIVGTGTATAEPVRLVESGPAAGVLANREVADAHGETDVFSFDMGGTTAKGSIVQDGEIQMTYETDVAREHRFKPGSGFDIIIPTIDITEIGAGGGSIASIDKTTELLQVGPQSAGSDPGPICYDRGGEAPTVTDAALVLGYLAPDRFMGGQMALASDATETIVRDSLAEPLDLSITETAWQVVEIVSENMANAFRQHTASQGIDPRGITMVAIGGAGPMTAFNVARKVGIEEIVCPFGAGVGSSIGLIMAPKLYEASSTRRAVLADLDADTMAGEFRALYERAVAVLDRSGANSNTVETDFSLDMRHVNQGHEITVPLPGTDPGDVTPVDAREQFQTTYRQLFSRDVLDIPIEVINYRVQAHEPSDARGGEGVEPTPVSATDEATSRPVYFGGHGHVDAEVRRWAALSPGDSLDGPAVIEADQSTVVVDPDASVSVTAGPDLRISLE